MIVVIAHWRARPDAVDRVAMVLAAHAAASEAELGCLGFRAHQDAADPARFALYESYLDEAAFEAHRASDHFRANIEETIAPLLLDREWRVYGPAL